MKKINLFFVFLILIFFFSFVSSVWWNPISWFADNSEDAVIFEESVMMSPVSGVIYKTIIASRDSFVNEAGYSVQMGEDYSYHSSVTGGMSLDFYCVSGVPSETPYGTGNIYEDSENFGGASGDYSAFRNLDFACNGENCKLTESGEGVGEADGRTYTWNPTIYSVSWEDFNNELKIEPSRECISLSSEGNYYNSVQYYENVEEIPCGDKNKIVITRTASCNAPGNSWSNTYTEITDNCAVENNCNDGIDNDCDGKIDCFDIDCRGEKHCQEDPISNPGSCEDGKNNDPWNNFEIDCNDIKCVNSSVKENCNDGIDNNCNGKLDCADDACPAKSDCTIIGFDEFDVDVPGVCCGDGCFVRKEIEKNDLSCCEDGCFPKEDKEHCGGCSNNCSQRTFFGNLFNLEIDKYCSSKKAIWSLIPGLGDSKIYTCKECGEGVECVPKMVNGKCMSGVCLPGKNKCYHGPEYTFTFAGIISAPVTFTKNMIEDSFEQYLDFLRGSLDDTSSIMFGQALSVCVPGLGTVCTVAYGCYEDYTSKKEITIKPQEVNMSLCQ